MPIASKFMGLMAALSLTACGCYNPTGYCGDNIPDPDRVGGAKWMLETTAQEREAYFQAKCAETLANPALLPEGYTQSQCVRNQLRGVVRDTCFQRHTPVRRLDDAEEEEAERATNACTREILRQHGL